MDPYRRASQRIDRVLDPAKVVPFGIYGAGLWTGRPIGIVILIGLFVMVFAALPGTQWFFVLSVPAGIACGLFVWFRHRNGFAAS